MYNIGMRRTTEDLGRATTAPDASPFHNPLDGGKSFPLSYVELCALRDAGKLPPDVARFVPDLHGQSLPRRVTQGAFKVPNLRNSECTGPYFHSGDSATLRQVVEFYTRGGNFPATNFANLTVNLVEPGTMYGERINQLDVRMAKALKTGRSRITIALDIYNALNSSAVLTYNNAFVPGGTWLQPQTILTPRFFRITGELDL